MKQESIVNVINMLELQIEHFANIIELLRNELLEKEPVATLDSNGVCTHPEREVIPTMGGTLWYCKICGYTEEG